MKILVTGAAGFVGGHVLQRLRESGHQVVATSRDGRVGRAIELPDDSGARELIAESRPDAVLHLAARSAVGDAEQNPLLAYETNVHGTRSLLEAVEQTVPGCHFVFASSSAAYGRVPERLQPITEETGLHPVNVYGWTKLGAEALLRTHSRSPGGVPTTILRPFNHTGPGQREDFALSGFARQIALIEAGRIPPVVEVGDLSVRRDILDVRDVANAYGLVIERGPASPTYNVCTGSAQPLRDLLDELIGLAEVGVEVRVDPQRLRSNDLTVLVGDGSLLHRDTGWKPAIPMRETLSSLLDHWRRAISKSMQE